MPRLQPACNSRPPSTFLSPRRLRERGTSDRSPVSRATVFLLVEPVEVIASLAPCQGFGRWRSLQPACDSRAPPSASVHLLPAFHVLSPRRLRERGTSDRSPVSRATVFSLVEPVEVIASLAPCQGFGRWRSLQPACDSRAPPSASVQLPPAFDVLSPRRLRERGTSDRSPVSSATVFLLVEPVVAVASLTPCQGFGRWRSLQPACDSRAPPSASVHLLPAFHVLSPRRLRERGTSDRSPVSRRKVFSLVEPVVAVARFPLCQGFGRWRSLQPACFSPPVGPDGVHLLPAFHVLSPRRLRERGTSDRSPVSRATVFSLVEPVEVIASLAPCHGFGRWRSLQPACDSRVPLTTLAELLSPRWPSSSPHVG
ncbi:hypothetical protein SAMN04489834_1514 [Microterricola viridarii]|uniref:Uncharacterized protein n=1 Tax=Microterricola viridarii TaxID=412690 RepID=A0A1H1SCH4_9MICO|nr:hypothetical protein SAMN04489834_1514 [Microterricola viridarii]